MEQNGRVTRPTTGVPSIEGQPQITPFVITKDYKELVTPLIEEAHRDKRFEKTTYEGISNFSVVQWGYFHVMLKVLACL